MDQIWTLDFHRILLGDEPPLFLLEIGLRTIIVYAYTLALLRWLGSRTVGQLSTIEFLLVIALGSAVGDVMFYPDVPLIHALLVITIVVFANKALDLVIAKSNRAEKILDGAPQEIVRDGIILKSVLDHQFMSRNELFQELREKGIRQLGEIWRAYIEKDGRLTVFRAPGDAPAGLPIVPPPQIEPSIFVDPASQRLPLVCTDCGGQYSGRPSCEHCGGEKWTFAATLSPD